MAKRELELGWLRLFESLGRLGNLTRVAEAHGLTQPAVSYQLRRLEEDLGTPLIRRLHRGTELTREGQLLYEAVRESLERIDGAARQIRNREKPHAVRIHTDFGFASYWLMPRIEAFRRLEPEIEVHILASQSMEAGNVNDADITIAFGHRQDFGATAVQLMEEKVMPVCAPGFLHKHGILQDADSIARQRLLHLEGDTRSRWFSWQTWLQEGRVHRKPSLGDLSFNTYNLVIQAALAEQGIALGWVGLVDDLLKSGLLVAAGPNLRRPDYGYWLVSPTPDVPFVRKLREWLQQESAAGTPATT